MTKSRFNRLSRVVAALLTCFVWPTTGHATLYVIVLNRQGIAIASDSRHITLEGKKITTSDGVEKLVSLGAGSPSYRQV